MEEHSNYAMFYNYYKITTIRARTLRGLTTSLVCKLHKACEPYTGKISTQVHNVDGPHKGSSRISKKVDGHHEGKKHTQVHNVDEPHKGSRL